MIQLSTGFFLGLIELVYPIFIFFIGDLGYIVKQAHMVRTYHLFISNMLSSKFISRYSESVSLDFKNYLDTT